MKPGGKNKQKSYIRDLYNWNGSVLLGGGGGLILKNKKKLRIFNLRRSDRIFMKLHI